jgi:23S rRNA pseudouridine1911/1915/1917 synthase
MEDKDNVEELEQNDLFEHYNFAADAGQTLLRIDKFLLARIESTSRNKIQNVITAGNVLVNDKVVKANYRVRPFDKISLVMPYPPRETEVLPENIPLEIVYEDDDVLVINKPAGLVVHPGYANYTGTLVNALVYHFGNLPSSSELAYRPGLVHRLDKNTSGIMVIAKTEIALSSLAKQFFDRTISRKYHALVWGRPKLEDGIIEGNVGRSHKNRKIMDVFLPDSGIGKHAITHYKMEKPLGYVSVVECKLETGRTHQIRVHMKHLGHPLFNDESYGGDKILKGLPTANYKRFVQNCFALIPGQALHAKTLEFTHPKTAERMKFTSELPQGYLDIIDKFERAELTT